MKKNQWISPAEIIEIAADRGVKIRQQLITEWGRAKTNPVKRKKEGHSLFLDRKQALVRLKKYEEFLRRRRRRRQMREQKTGVTIRPSEIIDQCFQRVRKKYEISSL